MVEAVHFSSARKTGGPSQPLSRLYLRLGVTALLQLKADGARGSFTCLDEELGFVHVCSSFLIARLLRVAAALDACWVASSLGRSGPFQQCKKNGRAKSAALEIVFETWCYGAPTTEG